MGHVESVLTLLGERPATLGGARLLCIDGPGGSGKTTLARAVAERTGAHVVHMDDLYDGWSGLPRVDAQVATLLRPLAEGRPGRYRHYDWDADAWAGTVEVDHPGPGGLLVLAGGASGSRACAARPTGLVWVEAPRDVRRARGLARDGAHLREVWLGWQASEDEHFAHERTRERADLVVSGTASRPTPAE